MRIQFVLSCILMVEVFCYFIVCEEQRLKMKNASEKNGNSWTPNGDLENKSLSLSR